MSNSTSSNSFMHGLLICTGLIGLGYFISSGIIGFKQLDRVVTVKGLSEKEVPADIAIWPIKFNEVSNDLNVLYATVQKKTDIVEEFLKENGFSDEEITISVPAIEDRQAQGYYDAEKQKYRYSSSSTVTVYTEKVGMVVSSMAKLLDLGKRGLTIAGRDYDARVEFLFTKLNDIKPEMVEEATKNGREVAVKFAKDSDSELGKIKRANQGQFSIRDRDSNTPYIKTVRVVVTLEYYLSD